MVQSQYDQTIVTENMGWFTSLQGRCFATSLSSRRSLHRTLTRVLTLLIPPIKKPAFAGCFIGGDEGIRTLDAAHHRILP
jgi:hypothetical protein